MHSLLLISLAAASTAGWHQMRTVDPMTDAETIRAVSVDPNATKMPDEGVFMVQCTDKRLTFVWSGPDGTNVGTTPKVQLRFDRRPALTVPAKRVNATTVLVRPDTYAQRELLTGLTSAKTLLVEVPLWVDGGNSPSVKTISLSDAQHQIINVLLPCAGAVSDAERSARRECRKQCETTLSRAEATLCDAPWTDGLPRATFPSEEYCQVLSLERGPSKAGICDTIARTRAARFSADRCISGN